MTISELSWNEAKAAVKTLSPVRLLRAMVTEKGGANVRCLCLAELSERGFSAEFIRESEYRFARHLAANPNA